MPRIMADRQADQFLVLAFFAWGLSCVHPALGLLIQLPLLAILIWRCDIKIIPALMILSLDKSALRGLAGSHAAFKVGITMSSANFFMILVALYAIGLIVKGRLDYSSKILAMLWLPSAIPAFAISLHAKSMGFGGMWSNAIMDFMVPGMYFWGVDMARTYEMGRDYFLKRMTTTLFILIVLHLILVIQIFTFTLFIFSICLAIYYSKAIASFPVKFQSNMAFLLSIVAVIFLRYFYLKDLMEEKDSVKLEYSSFSTVAVVVIGVLLAYFLRRNRNTMGGVIPMAMVCANLALVSFVLVTQSGNDYRDVDVDYQTVVERFNFKLFGDRAAVWREGWEDCKSTPYVFKDMRQFLIDTPKGTTVKLYPHNQFLTLISRDGWWLGLFLSAFIIIAQVRAFKALKWLHNDESFATVIVPVGAAIFAVIGTTGQSVATPGLWSNGLACLVLPGIAHGYGQHRLRFSIKGF